MTNSNVYDSLTQINCNKDGHYDHICFVWKISGIPKWVNE